MLRPPDSDSIAHHGLILQSSYRIVAGRAVVFLYGRLDDGRTFLVRERREVPRFWIRASDAARAVELGAAPLVATAKTTFRNEPVVRVEAALPADVPALRDRLTGAGIPCYEADVRFALRYLIDRGLRSTVEIRGTPTPGDGVDVAFDDPELRAGSRTPALTILSFDIETDPRAQTLLSISLEGCGASEVLLLTPEGLTCPHPAIPFASERALIAGFCRRVRELDPDVLVGWNVVDFDLAVLDRMAKRLGVPFEIGRGAGPVRIDSGRFPRVSSLASIPGRMVLDGIALLRGAFIPMEEYSLDFVARRVLGEGKLIHGHDRAEEILRTFHEDRERFVAYNLADSRLVLEILAKLRLVELAVERSRLTGMPLDRVASSIAAFDFVYLSELVRRDVVAPGVGVTSDPSEPTTGGHVLAPEPGLYRNVLVLDFKSLYPSVIRTFQIDPLGYLPDPSSDAHPIVAPNGAPFRRTPGILPAILDELFPKREAAKLSGDAVSSQAIKILMNSFYGVLGTPACRFHNPDIANAITSFGREVLLWSKARIESYGLRVVYGDTDSLFVLSAQDDPDAARRVGEQTVRALNDELTRHVRERWDVESRLELEFDTLYLRLILPRLRHGAGGARKRYAGLVEDHGERRVVFTGMEAVRRDATEVAKRVQRELYERIFEDRPVEEYLKSIVSDLRAGRLDDLLVYRKRLSKDLDAYTATTPPHVAAARKLSGEPGRRIAYVMTVNGPEPLAERRSALDHEHYVQKQVRPVAEPVLELLKIDFDRAIGDSTQLSLF